MCGFLENNKCLHLGTPVIVTFSLLQTDPGPHQRREKLCGPHRKKFGDPCFRWTDWWSERVKKKINICGGRDLAMTEEQSKRRVQGEVGRRYEEKPCWCRSAQLRNSRAEECIVFLIVLSVWTTVQHGGVLAINLPLRSTEGKSERRRLFLKSFLFALLLRRRRSEECSFPWAQPSQRRKWQSSPQNPSPHAHNLSGDPPNNPPPDTP